MSDPALIDYRCTECRAKQFRARGLSYDALEVKCHACGHLTTPAPLGEAAAEHVCPSCFRESIRVMAPSAVGYCARCGVETVPVPALPKVTPGSSPPAPRERATVRAPTV